MGSVLGIMILGFIAAWMLGGLMLRFFGMFLLILAAFGLAFTGDIFVGMLVLLPGLVLWLAGHWHYAYRWHEWYSPLAQRIFCDVLPRRMDPTRGYGYPVHLVEPDPRRPQRHRRRRRFRRT